MTRMSTGSSANPPDNSDDDERLTENLVRTAISVVAQHPAVHAVELAGSRSRGEQWEPMCHFPVYQILMRGPTKVEYLFLDHSQDAAKPVSPGPSTLVAIDTHFWDWIWWIATKASVGRDDLVAEHLPQLYNHLLRPMGVEDEPTTIDAAIHAYRAGRDQLESSHGVVVPRALGGEVRRGIERVL
jgi:hypothetical protein